MLLENRRKDHLIGSSHNITYKRKQDLHRKKISILSNVVLFKKQNRNPKELTCLFLSEENPSFNWFEKLQRFSGYYAVDDIYATGK